MPVVLSKSTSSDSAAASFILEALSRLLSVISSIVKLSVVPKIPILPFVTVRVILSPIIFGSSMKAVVSVTSLNA